MNRFLLRSYIAEYERQFAQIHSREIYKWRAVKQFQDAWDINADNFAEMLSNSLSKTENLMDSGNYFPRRVIIRNAEKEPQTVRSAFRALFMEENDVIERIKVFREQIKDLNRREFPKWKDFQDQRAVLVYLTLRYPETYFFYKYKMFKGFCEKTDHDYKPVPGAYSNIVQFLYLCTEVRDEIVQNNNLVKLHKDRLGTDEYFDVSFNILVQDFVYAVTSYLTLDARSRQLPQPGITRRDIHLEPIKKQYRFRGRYIDFVSRSKNNKRIGDIGEQLVLRYEKSNCSSEYADKVVHSAKTEGDGLGFDILSFDSEGNPKYIEVKTTKGQVDTPFYISRTELERSRKEGENYYLYRLYNLDEEKMTADFVVFQGDLGKFCINATEYEVIVKKSEGVQTGHA